MSLAKKLIEQGPDDIRGKDYLSKLPDPRTVEFTVRLQFTEPFDELDLRDLTYDLADALHTHAKERGFPGEATVADCTVTPVKPIRGTPAGWTLGE